MAELLLEIGLEELPASFVHGALRSMHAAADDLLAQHRLGGESRVLGTPRRLTLHVEDLPERTPDREQSVTGPPWQVAFKNGEPTKAALGFAKKNKLDVADLEKVTTDKGDYVGATVRESGQNTGDALVEVLHTLFGRITFPKSMRWGEGEYVFGRPVHWLVALLDDASVDVSLAGGRSGRTSRGHRFLAPATFELAHARDYVKTLESAHVIAEVAERRKRMHAQLIAAADAIGGMLIEDEWLLSECTSMVEEPFVVTGTFEPRFLELPDEVVISVMRDHQWYFAVRDADGKLLPKYFAVANTACDPDRIAAGNDRVLRARLKDAAFFIEEDRKRPLSDRRRTLDNQVFLHELKAGASMGAKVERITKLATHFANALQLDGAHAERAAQLAKCDLETHIVFEFTELQGKMGAFYARHDGEEPPVCSAIAEHYQPQGADDDVAPSPLGALLAVADRVDTLVGAFLIGKEPKGNRDNLGLRRAAIGVLRTAFEGPIDVDLEGWLVAAEAQYGFLKKVKDGALQRVREFFDARLRVWLADRYPRDLVEACIRAWRQEAGGHSLRDLRDRIEAVGSLRQTPAYELLAIAFKRAFNISKDAPRDPIDAALVENGTEKHLVELLAKVQPEIDALSKNGDYAGALTLVAEQLKAPVDQYFDDVLVIHDDPTIRANRLSTVGQIADCVSRIVHFHELEP